MTTMFRTRSILTAVIAGAIALSACGGGSSTTKGTQPGKGAVNPAELGTKAAAHYQMVVPSGEAVSPSSRKPPSPSR